jgi:hypothetical protein
MYDAVPFQVRCTWQIAVCLCRNTKVRCLQFNGSLYCSPECLRMATKEEDDKVVRLSVTRLQRAYILRRSKVFI